ncbi:hypothetical protein [Streptomyces sp. NPDC053560]|uniref:hypothetical protein n=1 Tax=Streptomyces sp. NPDC053560 TaxID=3365711 RepID=UPI0037D87AA0
MAGESPDKSEQKQSSGETAGSERDPRLAVFRDAPTDTETSAEPDSVAPDTGRDDAEPEGPRAADSETPKAGASSAVAATADNATAGGKKAGGGKAAGKKAAGGKQDAGASDAEEPDAEKAGPEEADAGQGAPEKGDARLKAAVAAWVAGKGAQEDETGAEGAEKAEARDGASEGPSGAEKTPAGDAAGATGAGTEADDAAKDREGTAKGGEDAESGLPVRKPGAKGKQDAGQVDQPTAVFGTLAPKSPPADEATRVFAAVNPKGVKKGAGKDAPKGAEDVEGGKGTKDAKKDTKKDAEARKATAAAIPKRSDAAKKAAAGTPDADKGESKSEAGGGAKKADAESEGKSTASPEKAADGEKAAEGEKPAADKKSADGERAPEADKKLTDKKSTDADKSKKPAEADKNADAAAGKGEKGEKKDAERDSERTSQFVALKSTDERPVKPPKPVSKPTGKSGVAADTPKAKAPADTSKAPAEAAKSPGDPAATAAMPAAVSPAGPQPPAAPSSSAAPEAGPGALPESERTKQQPLPPLDLLAQLTNTPPPPETPIRTIVRRFKIWTPLALLLLLVFVIVQAVRPLPDPGLTLTADATYSFDGSKPSMPWPSEGQAYVDVSGLGPIGSYGDQKPVPIGSVAKTMTAYIIMRDHPLKPGKPGKKIRIDKQAEEDGKKGAGHGDESVLDTVKEGDTITQKDALSAVMIPSANNIARLLARWDAGSQEAFVKKMNATAKELGMKNTTYTDPSGLIETTVSTAEDQVKLGKKAMEMPALVDITKLPSWTDPSGKQWRNYNTLPPYNNAIGLKTGSTSKAGGNLLFAGRQQVGDTTQLIVGAVLGQHRTPIIDTANAVSKGLLTTTQDALEDRTVLKKGDVVGVVDDGLGGTTPVVVTEDVKAVGWNGLTVKLGLSDNGKTIPHEAKAGTKVGVLTAGSGPGQVKVPVELQEGLTEPTFGAKLTRVS